MYFHIWEFKFDEVLYLLSLPIIITYLIHSV